MKLMNAVLTCEEVIKLDRCYLIKSPVFLITDYLLVYTDNGTKWACLGIDDSDIDWVNKTIDVPCIDGADYHFTFTDVVDSKDRSLIKIHDLISDAYLSAIENGCLSFNIQNYIMDQICKCKNIM